MRLAFHPIECGARRKQWRFHRAVEGAPHRRICFRGYQRAGSTGHAQPVRRAIAQLILAAALNHPGCGILRAE
jgi:hypothetical protein